MGLVYLWGSGFFSCTSTLDSKYQRFKFWKEFKLMQLMPPRRVVNTASDSVLCYSPVNVSVYNLISLIGLKAFLLWEPNGKLVS